MKKSILTLCTLVLFLFETNTAQNTAKKPVLPPASSNRNVSTVKTPQKVVAKPQKTIGKAVKPSVTFNTNANIVKICCYSK